MSLALHMLTVFTVETEVLYVVCVTSLFMSLVI